MFILFSGLSSANISTPPAQEEINTYRLHHLQITKRTVPHLAESHEIPSLKPSKIYKNLHQFYKPKLLDNKHLLIENTVRKRSSEGTTQSSTSADAAAAAYYNIGNILFVNEHDNTTLYCVTSRKSSNNRMNIIWYKNNKKLTLAKSVIFPWPKPKTNISSHQQPSLCLVQQVYQKHLITASAVNSDNCKYLISGSLLFINDVNLSDAGLYQCAVSEHAKRVVKGKKISLNIIGKKIL